MWCRFGLFVYVRVASLLWSRSSVLRPEDVIMQPEWVKDAALVRTMRPVLNRWLGGFGDALSNAEAGEER